MQAKNVHCTVVEVDRDAHLVSVDAQDPPRDLLPWADPYIARLLSKYRLQAALDDSLRFVSDEAARACTPVRERAGIIAAAGPPTIGSRDLRPANRVVRCRRLLGRRLRCRRLARTIRWDSRRRSDG